MLAAGQKQMKESKAKSTAKERVPGGSEDVEPAGIGPEGADGEQEPQQELLPTEDDFLRLDDMEAFVQVPLSAECGACVHVRGLKSSRQRTTERICHDMVALRCAQ